MNEKIEGFFDVCKTRGLNGSHGVIIPFQNVKDLMLKEEVIKAVKEKKFRIYSVSKVEEAIEILTGISAGKKSAGGKYQPNTIFGEVEKELTVMKKLLKPPAAKGNSRSKEKAAPQKKRKTKK